MLYMSSNMGFDIIQRVSADAGYLLNVNHHDINSVDK